MSTPEAAGGLLREERRQFKIGCISAGLALLTAVGVAIFVHLNDGKVASMAAAGASTREILRLRVRSMAAQEYASLVLLLCGLVSLRALLKWLFAIQRRRRAGGGLPPAAAR